MPEFENVGEQASSLTADQRQSIRKLCARETVKTLGDLCDAFEAEHGFRAAEDAVLAVCQDLFVEHVEPWAARYARGSEEGKLLKLPRRKRQPTQNPRSLADRLQRDAKASDEQYEAYALDRDLQQRFLALLDGVGAQPDEDGWRRLAVALALKHEPTLQFAPPHLRSETHAYSEHWRHDRMMDAYLATAPNDQAPYPIVQGEAERVAGTNERRFLVALSPTESAWMSADELESARAAAQPDALRPKPRSLREAAKLVRQQLLQEMREDQCRGFNVPEPPTEESIRVMYLRRRREGRRAGVPNEVTASLHLRDIFKHAEAAARRISRRKRRVRKGGNKDGDATG